MTDPTAAAFARIVGTVDRDLMKDYPQPSVPDTVPSGLKQETRVTIKPEQVKRNAFTQNLANDWIGTDDSGNVIVRGDEQTVRRNPDATSFFTKADLDQAAVRQDPATDPGNPTAQAFAKITAAVDPSVMKDYEPAPAAEAKLENVEKNDSGAEAKAAELEEAKAEVAKMDPDGDGKVGGSRKRKPSAKK